MAQNGNTDQKISRDTLALIIGGVFVLALVFAAYTYFNRGRSGTDTFTNRIEDILSTDTEREEQPTEKETQPSNEQKPSAIGTGGPAQAWVANDYQQGDIKAGNYTVVSGDTLWERAEAVYGDGTQWTKILEANSSKVGFLPNGQQALIIPGQVLVIP